MSLMQTRSFVAAAAAIHCMQRQPPTVTVIEIDPDQILLFQSSHDWFLAILLRTFTRTFESSIVVGSSVDTNLVITQKLLSKKVSV
jgi:hypothetical protein